MLRKGKFTAPNPLSMATVVTPNTPMRAMSKSADSPSESILIKVPDRYTAYQNAGSAAAVQARDTRREPWSTERVVVHTKQAGNAT
mmetsp:Transcript_599/g.1963  ORF Transcript_599/g.1963 Transcript_599/m.1963 type:complete len:86 (+) Transcript_599:122-379(+)